MINLQYLGGIYIYDLQEKKAITVKKVSELYTAALNNLVQTYFLVISNKN